MALLDSQLDLGMAMRLLSRLVADLQKQAFPGFLKPSIIQGNVFAYNEMDTAAPDRGMETVRQMLQSQCSITYRLRLQSIPAITFIICLHPALFGPFQLCRYLERKCRTQYENDSKVTDLGGSCMSGLHRMWRRRQLKFAVFLLESNFDEYQCDGALQRCDRWLDAAACGERDL
jgi:hypothetical protein